MHEHTSATGKLARSFRQTTVSRRSQRRRSFAGLTKVRVVASWDWAKEIRCTPQIVPTLSWRRQVLNNAPLLSSKKGAATPVRCSLGMMPL